MEKYPEGLKNTRIAFENAFKVLKDNYNEEIIAHQEKKLTVIVPPITVILAFCIEITLKNILYRDNQKHHTGHNLFKLFSMLDEEIQVRIKKRIEERISDIFNMLGKGFNELLDENKNIFVSLRYLYEEDETKFLNIHYVFLEELYNALNNEL